MTQLPPSLSHATADSESRAPATSIWLFVALATLVGLNLRASLGSVPPLLPAITSELHLSGTTQGLLTSISVLFIGLCAPPGQRLASHIGAERATAVMLALLALGCGLRLVAGDTAMLLISSATSGAGMGGATALMPGLIARHVPRVRGLTMGMYSTGLAMGVAIAAWAAVPTQHWTGGWRPALALWGVVALATMILWTLVLPRLRTGRKSSATADFSTDQRLPWRSRTAWWITWYATSAMITGFSGLAWITPMYVELGVSNQHAADYFVVFQVVQLIAMLTLPPITDFTTDRRPLLAVSAGCSIVGLALLLISPLAMAIPAMCLFGLGAGSGAAMVLILIVDAARTQSEANRLSGMVMLIAYAIGAFAPMVLGLLRDLTGGLTVGYGIVLVAMVLTAVTLPVFGPDRTLDSPESAAARD